MKKWTLDDGKTRHAGLGPWIALDKVAAFIEFCNKQGHPTRVTGKHEVQYQGHWMALRWNSSFKRYTADRRLALIVQSFAMEST